MGAGRAFLLCGERPTLLRIFLQGEGKGGLGPTGAETRSVGSRGVVCGGAAGSRQSGGDGATLWAGEPGGTQEELPGPESTPRRPRVQGETHF